MPVVAQQLNENLPTLEHPVTEDEPTERASPEDTFSVVDGVKAVLGCLGSVAVVAGLYLGTLALLGEFPSEDFTTTQYALGALAMVVTGGVVSMAGESLIEDVVKFVFIGGGFLLIYRGQEGLLALLALGVTMGTGLPLLARPVARLLERGEDSPAAGRTPAGDGG